MVHTTFPIAQTTRSITTGCRVRPDASASVWGRTLDPMEEDWASRPIRRVRAKRIVRNENQLLADLCILEALAAGIARYRIDKVHLTSSLPQPLSVPG